LARSEPEYRPADFSPVRNCIAKAGTTVWLALYSGAAAAHAGTAGGNDLYAGALHALGAPAQVLAFAALGLLGAWQPGRTQSMLALFCLALIAGTLASIVIPLPQAPAPIGLVVAATLGALVAAAPSLPGPMLLALAAFSGLGLGWSNGMQSGPGTSGWLFAAGTGLAGLAVSTYCLMAADYLLRRNAGWMRIAVRVAGSWITAIAILVLAITVGISLKG
jgi:urease accessory protein